MDTGTVMCRKHYHVLNLYPGVFYARHQMQNSRDWFHSTDIHHFNKQMVPYKNIITLKHTRTLKTGLANNMKHMGLISIWVDFHKAGNFGSSAHHASSPRSSQLHFRSDLGIIAGMVGWFSHYTSPVYKGGDDKLKFKEENPISSPSVKFNL